MFADSSAISGIARAWKAAKIIFEKIGSWDACAADESPEAVEPSLLYEQLESNSYGSRGNSEIKNSRISRVHVG